MLFMVIEVFRNRDAKAIGERFRREGRMLPADVTYHASWIDEENMRCFQLMEGHSMQALEPWIARWKDLVEFEVVPVVSSGDFWAQRPSE